MLLLTILPTFPKSLSLSLTVNHVVLASSLLSLLTLMAFSSCLMYHCLRSWAIYMKKTTGKATNKPANVAARLRFLPTVTRKINVKSNKRREREETKGKAVIVNRRRSGQSVTVSDFGSNGPRFESGRGRCVESLDKALYSHCHVVLRRSLHISFY